MRSHEHGMLFVHTHCIVMIFLFAVPSSSYEKGQ